MLKRKIICMFLVIGILLPSISFGLIKGYATKKVIKKADESKISSFKLDQVSLLDGPFKKARDKNLEVMNAINADTISYAFRYNAKTNYRATGTNFDTIPGTSMGGGGQLREITLLDIWKGTICPLLLCHTLV